MYPRGAHPNPLGQPRGRGPPGRNGSIPGSFPQQNPGQNAQLPPQQPPLQNQSQFPGQYPPAFPRNGANPGRPPSGPSAGGPGPDRRSIADKLIADCYSNFIPTKTGKRVPEIAYQTHLGITEYSSFPSQPPPENLPPSQLGSVKPRILVICVKQSGRVLLQKGKFNDAKNLYQIGRTWDLDELKGITRVGNTGIILSLNKDYYWRVEEGMERIWKFVRYLANAYGGFVGRYPDLKGFTVKDLNLAPTPVKRPLLNSPVPGANNPKADIVLTEPTPDPALLKSKSLKRKNLPNPVLPPQPQPQAPLAPKQNASDYYKGFDFTSNGQLPVKPMTVISSDRGANSPENTTLHTSVYSNTETSPKVGSHPYKANSPFTEERKSEIDLNETTDSHSFVFTGQEAYSPEKLHEYAKDVRETSPLRNFKPRNSKTTGSVQRNVSDGFATSAALANQLEDHLDKRGSDYENELIREFSEGLPKPPKPNGLSPDFGIEEITDESDVDTPQQAQPSKFIETKGLGINNSHGIIGESTNIEGADGIDESIQEIEDLLDSQLSFGNNNKELESHESSFEYEKPLVQDNDTQNTTQLEAALSIKKKEPKIPLEKDSELEEILEIVNWTVTDSTDSLLKKLNRELDQVKQKNVKELIALDTTKGGVSNDMVVSIGEIDHLTHIFKKMEVDFKFLASDVQRIENDSQGLQVKSINKKILFRDLQSILEKVSLNNDDLGAIEEFREFERLNKLQSLEEKLLRLFDALGTIRNDEDNDLSSMKALKQYQATYEKVNARFIKHFNNFIRQQLLMIIGQLSEDIVSFRPNNLLRELNNLMIYSGITYFVKEVDHMSFNSLNDFFNQQIEDFLAKIISTKLKGIKFTTATSSLGQLSPSGSVKGSPSNVLKKSRTLRLSRKVSKLGSSSPVSHDDTEHIQQHMENLKNYRSDNINEIEDPKVIFEIIEESKDLIVDVQYFITYFFHYDKSNTNLDFTEFIANSPYRARRELLDELPSHQVEKFTKEKIYSSNDLIINMTSIFGNYINVILKKINPIELNLPLILIYLETVLNRYGQLRNVEYLTFNFLKKMIDKFKNGWAKFIKSQQDALDSSMVMAKGGILPTIKNINQLILIIESSLESNHNIHNTSVRSLLDKSYDELADSLIGLFTKDDPLLKNHEFDDKEREYRNISILQNIYFITQQLSMFSNPGLKKIRSRLDSLFAQVEALYFQRMLAKNVGKLVEFINNYEALEKMNNGKPKKYNKKFVKTLLSGYHHKELHVKVEEVYKKLERHFIVGKDMFEKDLLEKLWNDLEEEFVGYFKRLDKIMRSGFDDVEWSLGGAEVRQIFTSVH